MRVLPIFLLLAALIVGCSTPKPVEGPSSPPSPPPAALAPDANMLLELCGCPNSQGLTMEEYAEEDRKSQGLPDHEYLALMEKQLTSAESASTSWVMQQYGRDPQFLDCAKAVAFKYKKLLEKDERVIEKWFEQSRNNYPICTMALPELLIIITQ